MSSKQTNLLHWQYGHSVHTATSYEEHEHVIEITTTEPNQTFKWVHVLGTSGNTTAIDFYYGDVLKNRNTTVQQHLPAASELQHTFEIPGTYILKIVPKHKSFSGTIQYDIANNHGSLITNILNVSKYVNTFNLLFANTPNLRHINGDIFFKNVNVTYADGVFQRSGIEEIPAELFSKCTKIEWFSSVFSYCKNIKIVPDGLFTNNRNAANFNYGFYGCSSLHTVPVSLFDTNNKVNRLTKCFYNCTSLTNRPKPMGLELWQLPGTGFGSDQLHLYSNNIFGNCTSMPDYDSLPANQKA